MQHSRSIMPAMQQQRSRCSNANSTKAQSWGACVLLYYHAPRYAGLKALTSSQTRAGCPTSPAEAC
jgi:hypothetical protein